MIPAGDFLFSAEAALFGGVLAQEVEGHVTQGGQIGGGVAGAHAALILAQGDIEHPVQGVFDAPVAADGAGQFRGVRRKAAQIVATLARDVVADLALGFDHGHAAQGRPLGAVGQPVELVCTEVTARFDPTVIFFQRLMPTGRPQMLGMIEALIQEGFDLLVQDFVVGFERQDVVGVGLVDFPRNGFQSSPWRRG